tara:strand:- start:5176 stop:5457 length:282 start_codon:yes stop_codon:yes gene_type:complete
MDYQTWRNYMDAGADMDPDPVTETIAERVRTRSDIGMKKYGTNMLRKDLSTIQWIDHAIEEALDLAVYLERIKFDVKTNTEALLERQRNEIGF